MAQDIGHVAATGAKVVLSASSGTLAVHEVVIRSSELRPLATVELPAGALNWLLGSGVDGLLVPKVQGRSASTGCRLCSNGVCAWRLAGISKLGAVTVQAAQGFNITCVRYSGCTFSIWL